MNSNIANSRDSRSILRGIAILTLILVITAGIIILRAEDRGQDDPSIGFAQFRGPVPIHMTLPDGWKAIYHGQPPGSRSTIRDMNGASALEVLIEWEAMESDDDWETLDQFGQNWPGSLEEGTAVESGFLAGSSEPIWFGRYHGSQNVSPFGSQQRYETLVMNFETVNVTYGRLVDEHLIQFHFTYLQEDDRQLYPLTQEMVETAEFEEK